MKKILLIGIVLSGLGVYFFWPEPEPEPENKPSDTGLTREETEALMRKIGYVQ